MLGVKIDISAKRIVNFFMILKIKLMESSYLMC